jgi:putative ATP-binding cassette transporter
MKILQFMTQETTVSKQRVLLLAMVSGITNSLLLIIINQAATKLQDGVIEAQLFLQYLLTFILFIYAQRTSQRQAISAVEHALQRFRARIADKVRRCELRTIEQIGDISHYSSMTQGANTISQSVMYLITGIESLLVLIFASLYLLWLSPSSFVIATVLIGCAIVLLIRHYQKTFQQLSEASSKEGAFFARFAGMLQSFKQLKIHQRESDALFADIQQLATETGELKSRSNVRLLEDILLLNVIFYLLLLLVVFMLPSVLPTHEENLFQIITTILFMMEPVALISAAYPNLSKTNVAISNLYRLEAKLDDVKTSRSAQPVTSSYEDFDHISLQQATFTYRNDRQQPLFEAGPFTLACQRGSLTFITGGNGSGKSTLLKLLTSLYPPQSGCIQVNQQTLGDSDYAAYRALFSVVFSDFHLFERLYGVDESSAEEVNQWLQKFELDHKTTYENGCFTNIDLSTGERKRLACINAIIQHRPILVLDEPAADQDVVFRKRLYQEILPELKAAGKTLIISSHDEAYFNEADQVLYVQDGGLEAYKT